MTKFCPSITLLKDFVCGHLTNGKDLIVKSHLTFCPKCRKEVRKLGQDLNSFPEWKK